LEREKTSGLENLEKSGSESLEKNKWIRKFGKKQVDQKVWKKNKWIRKKFPENIF